MLRAETSADGAMGALPGQDLGEPRQEERLHGGDFRTNNAHLRLTQLLCLETFIAGISRRDYTMGLDPQEPNPLFYRAGNHLQAKTWSHVHLDHPKDGCMQHRRVDNLSSTGKQEEVAHGDSTRTLTSLSGCRTTPVEGSFVSSVPAGHLSGGLLWGCWEAFPLEPGAITQKPRISPYLSCFVPKFPVIWEVKGFC